MSIVLHKVADLSGALLDAAVATALGHRWRIDDETICYVKGRLHDPEQESAFCPSMYWDHGGPIIERERIAILPWTEANAVIWMPGGNEIDWSKSGPLQWWARADEVVVDWFEEVPEGTADYKRDGRGPTPLVAAMRAFCASRFGEEVDL